MEIVYYYDAGSKCCPVKKHFLQYRDNIKLLVDISKKIEIIAQGNGVPRGSFSKKLAGFDSFEIKQRKNSKTVIRILYFLHKNKMILLNAFEKPDNYDTDKERKKVDKQLEIAEQYIKRYKLNTNLYEKY